MTPIFAPCFAKCKPFFFALLGFFAALGVLSVTRGGPAQAQSPGVNLAALAAQVATLKAQVVALQATTAPITTTGSAAQGYLVTFTGANVQIVNGLGGTETQNGLGNLIVGYNEARNDGTDARTGSHNIVTGIFNNFTSSGGLIGGYGNSLGGQEEFAVGALNTATGHQSAVSGGIYNNATGDYASVGGGAVNTASGLYASVSGGYQNTAGGQLASVSGGYSNTAHGSAASVGGGSSNTANGNYSAVGGGHGGTVTADNGYAPTVAGPQGSQGPQGPQGAQGVQGPAGPGFTPAKIAVLNAFTLSNGVGTGTELTLSGVNLHLVNGLGSTDTTNGLGNLIVGYNAAGLRAAPGDVRTGSHNLVLGDSSNYSSYGGLVAGIYGTITAPYATVLGGYGNTASGNYSAVGGGQNNTADGLYASVSGGLFNRAEGTAASVGGGASNTANGQQASVSGGAYNTASGQDATASGGANRYQSHDYGWSGGHYATDGP